MALTHIEELRRIQPSLLKLFAQFALKGTQKLAAADVMND
jgi:hypothetical protein